MWLSKHLLKYILFALAINLNAFASNITQKQLKQVIAKVILNQKELRFAAIDLPKRIDAKVWFVGGTTSSIVYYAKKLIEEGKEVPESIHWYDIFYPDQDVDLAVDGTIHEVQSAQRFLDSEFNYFYGYERRSLWEALILRYDGQRGFVGPDEHFSQNTDSLSLGLLNFDGEKTNLRWGPDFEQPHKKNPFIESILNNKIYFFDKETHADHVMTQRGRNPKVISVLRAFAKSIRYGLDIPENDFLVMKDIVRSFLANGAEDIELNYVKSRALKLVKAGLISAQKGSKAKFLYDELEIKNILEVLEVKPNDIEELNALAKYVGESVDLNLGNLSHVGVDEIDYLPHGSIIEGTTLHGGNRPAFLLLREPDFGDSLEKLKNAFHNQYDSAKSKADALMQISREYSMAVKNGERLNPFIALTAKPLSTTATHFDCRDHALLIHLIFAKAGISSEIHSTHAHTRVLTFIDGEEFLFDGLSGNVLNSSKRDYIQKVWLPIDNEQTNDVFRVERILSRIRQKPSAILELKYSDSSAIRSIFKSPHYSSHLLEIILSLNSQMFGDIISQIDLNELSKLNLTKEQFVLISDKKINAFFDQVLSASKDEVSLKVNRFFKTSKSTHFNSKQLDEIQEIVNVKFDDGTLLTDRSVASSYLNFLENVNEGRSKIKSFYKVLPTLVKLDMIESLSIKWKRYLKPSFPLLAFFDQHIGDNKSLVGKTLFFESSAKDYLNFNSQDFRRIVQLDEVMTAASHGAGTEKLINFAKSLIEIDRVDLFSELVDLYYLNLSNKEDKVRLDDLFSRFLLTEVDSKVARTTLRNLKRNGFLTPSYYQEYGAFHLIEMMKVNRDIHFIENLLGVDLDDLDKLRGRQKVFDFETYLWVYNNLKKSVLARHRPTQSITQFVLDTIKLIENGGFKFSGDQWSLNHMSYFVEDIINDRGLRFGDYEITDKLLKVYFEAVRELLASQADEAGSDKVLQSLLRLFKARFKTEQLTDQKWIEIAKEYKYDADSIDFTLKLKKFFNKEPEFTEKVLLSAEDLFSGVYNVSSFPRINNAFAEIIEVRHFEELNFADSIDVLIFKIGNAKSKSDLQNLLSELQGYSQLNDLLYRLTFEVEPARQAKFIKALESIHNRIGDAVVSDLIDFTDRLEQRSAWLFHFYFDEWAVRSAKTSEITDSPSLISNYLMKNSSNDDQVRLKKLLASSNHSNSSDCQKILEEILLEGLD